MKEYQRFKKVKKVLLFFQLFIGLGAVFGSSMMFIDIHEAIFMKDLLPYFKVLPFADVLFQNFLFPGIALLIVNGITNLISAYLLIKNKKIGTILGIVFGVTLMLWIIIQFVIFPLNFMSVSYFIFGFCEALTGYIAYVFYTQEEFNFNLSDYPNVNKNENTIVIYFSRMGFTKKIAYEKANELNATIYEVKSTEKTSKTSGFWWCGRYGMMKKEMPIYNIDVNLEKFKKVFIVTPIWVFNIAAPIRSFCKQKRGKINNVSYILVHHMNRKFKNAVLEMDQLLNIKHEMATSICCKMGKYKRSVSIDG